jgi:hypothetical protein
VQAESYVTPLEDAEIDAIVALGERRTELRTVGYYGGADY